MKHFQVDIIHAAGRSTWNIIAPSSMKAAETALAMDVHALSQQQPFALISKPMTKGGSDE